LKPEEGARKKIDALLELAGWKIQDYKDLNLGSGVGVAARTGEIAYDGKVTFYDALPVAIAEHKKTVCITADEETQYRKLQPKNYPIELL